MSYMETPRHDRVWAEIDLDAVAGNLESMHRRMRPGTKLTAVVKADGYGHGALRIARHIETLDYLWGFAVATFEEGLELREGGITKPVLILGHAFPDCFDDLARLQIRPTEFEEKTLEELSGAAGRRGVVMPVHIAVDTGMGRIGIRPDGTGLAFVRRALGTPGICVEGIFTHFSRADETGMDDTRRQIREFTGFCDRIEKELGVRIPIRHSANSAGIIRFPEADMDMVRAGITMYGLWPSAEVPRDIVPLRPAMSIHSHVSYVKKVPAGTPVSYGGTYVTDRTTSIATIPVGYGDGYARGLSNKGAVLIQGRRAPVLGRVCMDQFMVDVTDIPGISEGEPVTLLGRDGDECITMEELGDLSGRFNYEFACCITPRVPRIYRGG